LPSDDKPKSKLNVKTEHQTCMEIHMSHANASLPPTPRTQVKRRAQRGNYDQTTIHQILDAGLICHVGFVVEGQPCVIPTAYGRIDDQIYIHGSPMSRMLRSLQQGIEVCLTVTLLDGLVLARSAFHHSMNYRSVVIFGTATVIEAPDAKMTALKAFTEHIIRDRWSEVRPPTPPELAGTLVLALSLTEASAKIRTGPPVDDEADYALPIWAGELPLRLVADAPVADPRVSTDVAIPEYIRRYDRGGGDWRSP
jgi:uncharacterized protein